LAPRGDALASQPQSEGAESTVGAETVSFAGVRPSRFSFHVLRAQSHSHLKKARLNKSLMLLKNSNIFLLPTFETWPRSRT
jgi:hypothetical protein